MFGYTCAHGIILGKTCEIGILYVIHEMKLPGVLGLG